MDAAEESSDTSPPPRKRARKPTRARKPAAARVNAQKRQPEPMPTPANAHPAPELAIVARHLVGVFAFLDAPSATALGAASREAQRAGRQSSVLPHRAFSEYLAARRKARDARSKEDSEDEDPGADFEMRLELPACDAVGAFVRRAQLRALEGLQKCRRCRAFTSCATYCPQCQPQSLWPKTAATKEFALRGADVDKLRPRFKTLTRMGLYGPMEYQGKTKHYHKRDLDHAACRRWGGMEGFVEALEKKARAAAKRDAALRRKGVDPAALRAEKKAKMDAQKAATAARNAQRRAEERALRRVECPTCADNVPEDENYCDHCGCPRCFDCGELGHRSFQCGFGGGRGRGRWW